MHRRSALVAAGGLLAALGSIWSPSSALGQGAVCDPRARPANLRFTLDDISGTRVSLGDYRGRVLLVNFWATWCAPCKVEIPHLVDLSARYERRGLSVIGVSVDEVVARIKPFAQQLKVNYPVLIGRDHDDLQQSFGPIRGVPRSVLIARDGTVCWRHTGIVSKDVLERTIAALL